MRAKNPTLSFLILVAIECLSGCVAYWQNVTSVETKREKKFPDVCIFQNVKIHNKRELLDLIIFYGVAKYIFFISKIGLDV